MSDYLVKCDLSGFTCKKSETRKMWNGLIVRKDFWEPRHPQDFIPSIKESSPKEVRNDQPDPPLFDGNLYYDQWLHYDQLLSYDVPSVFDVSMII